jgi:energy-coupling factor transporter ATP-binding protein EcfA2
MTKHSYLITGPSGSGKTALANNLTAAGYAAIDADSTQGISYFVNQNGKPVPYPQDAGASWWESHHYVWELDRLRKLIDSTNPSDGIVFLCGNAGNIDKAWGTFEKVFYLDIPEEVMKVRLTGADRENSFGRRLEEQDQLLRWVEGFKAQMMKLGAITIDATMPLDKVAAAILTNVKAGK